MVRLYKLLALIALLAPLVARGQVVTNDTVGLVNRSWSTVEDEPWYLRVHAVQGSTPYNLSSHRIDWTVRHVNTEALIVNSTGTIHVANPAQIIFRWTPTAPGTFRSVATIFNTAASSTVATIMDDTITVTSAPSAGGGSVSLDVRHIEGDYVGAVTGNYDRLHVSGTLSVSGNLDVAGTISALDETKVRKVGETNAVLLTTAPIVTVPNATNAASPATLGQVQAGYVSNGGATVNGQAISNGAAITISGSEATNLVTIYLFQPTGNLNSITVTIPQNYRALRIISTLREAEQAVQQRPQGIRFNGDTGSNYWWHFSAMNGVAPQYGLNENLSYLTGGHASTVSTGFNSTVWWMPGYSMTNMRKSAFVTSSTRGGHPSPYFFHGSGGWYNVNPVTSLTFFTTGATNWVDGFWLLQGVAE